MTFSMAISHSLLLLFLALIVPFIFPKFEDQIHHYILLFASIMIIGIGIKMLLDTFFLKKETSCNCSNHDEMKSTKKKINSKAAINLYQLKILKPEFKSSQINKNSIEINKASKNKASKPILIGFINGILPCPSALAVIGISAANTKGYLASTTIISYVIGFTLSMCVIAFFVLNVKNHFIGKEMSFKNWSRLQLGCSTIIILSGLYYCILFMNHQH